MIKSINLLLVCILLGNLTSADVTTYRGIDGSGTYAETGLLRTWPEGGPKRTWFASPGRGWGNVSVVGDKVYVIGGSTASLFVHALEDGKTLGEVKLGSAGAKGWPGSRTAPIIMDGMAAGGTPNGQLYGIDLTTMTKTWDLNAWKNFGNGKGTMGWGWSETPAKHGNLVIFSTASKNLETPPLVAIDIRTGKTVWEMAQEAHPDGKPKKYSAADGSGVVIQHRGRAIVAYPTYRYLVALDANTGKMLWEIPSEGPQGLPPLYIREKGWLLANLKMPNVDGKKVSSLTLLELSPDGTSYTIRWCRPFAHKSDYGFAAVSGDRIYTQGLRIAPVLDALGKQLVAPDPVDKKSGNTNKSDLLCLDLLTGKCLDHLDIDVSGGGHIVTAEGMVYVQDHLPVSPPDPSLSKEEQNLAKIPPLRMRLIQPTETGMKVVGNLTIPIRTKNDLGGSRDRDMSWYAAIEPVISHGRLFIRYGGLCVFDIRANPPK